MLYSENLALVTGMENTNFRFKDFHQTSTFSLRNENNVKNQLKHH